jgi:hypothetical protein
MDFDFCEIIMDGSTTKPGPNQSSGMSWFTMKVALVDRPLIDVGITGREQETFGP